MFNAFLIPHYIAVSVGFAELGPAKEIEPLENAYLKFLKVPIEHGADPFFVKSPIVVRYRKPATLVNS